MSTTTPTTFHPFSGLPKELRLKVWNLANPQVFGQRIVHLTERPVAPRKGCKKQLNGITLRSPPLAQILLASKEVAEAGYYTTLRPLLSQVAIIYSPRYDILRLDSVGMLPNIRLNQVFDLPTLNQISNFELDGNSMHPAAVTCNTDNVKLLTGLKTFKISGMFSIEPGFEAPPNINMKYEATSTYQLVMAKSPSSTKTCQLYEPVCKAACERQVGSNAIHAIYTRLTDHRERARYFDTHKFLNDAAEHCDNLPLSVEVVYRYVLHELVTLPNGVVVPAIQRHEYDFFDVIDGLVTMD